MACEGAETVRVKLPVTIGFTPEMDGCVLSSSPDDACVTSNVRMQISRPPESSSAILRVLNGLDSIVIFINDVEQSRLARRSGMSLMNEDCLVFYVVGDDRRKYGPFNVSYKELDAPPAAAIPPPESQLPDLTDTLWAKVLSNLTPEDNLRKMLGLSPKFERLFGEGVAFKCLRFPSKEGRRLPGRQEASSIAKILKPESVESFAWEDPSSAPSAAAVKTDADVGGLCVLLEAVGPNVKHLKIDVTAGKLPSQFYAELLTFLGRNPRLTWIECGRVEWWPVQHLPELVHLKYLSLTASADFRFMRKGDGECLLSAKCPSLQQLLLRGSGLHSKFWSGVQPTALEGLLGAHLPFAPQIPFPALKNLRQLGLQQVQPSALADLGRAVGQLVHLEVLAVWFPKKDGKAVLGKKVPRFSEKEVADFAQSLPPSLRQLFLWNLELSDKMCAVLARKCPQLRTLFSNSSLVTEAGVANLVDRCSDVDCARISLSASDSSGSEDRMGCLDHPALSVVRILGSSQQSTRPST